MCFVLNFYHENPWLEWTFSLEKKKVLLRIMVDFVCYKTVVFSYNIGLIIFLQEHSIKQGTLKIYLTIFGMNGIIENTVMILFKRSL